MKASKVTIAWSKLAGQADRIMREETRQHKGIGIGVQTFSFVINKAIGHCSDFAADQWPIALFITKLKV